MDDLVNRTCPTENMADNDPSVFWDNGPHWDGKISTACRSNYFDAVRDCYEAFVIAAFFALLTQYVEDAPEENKEELAKIKEKCSFPLWCYRYRPTNERFLNIAKWGILQYVVLIPLITLATLITEATGVYCAESMSFAFAKIYLKSLQILSVTVAMYALIVFYSAIKDAIASEKPFFKLLCVKLVVFFSFWQAVTLSILASAGVIHESQYWTKANISRGINSLIICFEMMIFAFLHVYAFPYKPFRDYGKRTRTPVLKGLMDALNPIDIVWEVIFVSQKVWDIYKQRHTKVSPEKDAFNIHRAITLKRQKHKYQNLEEA
ncbi:6737_t:CDS:2 [Dentiscutata erythropus]|uniref:6737_t:CDS:1 n=1 Tax=Dentiscutata erythropus TaxID=1348616 RepID=A0A9N9CKI0_9GLOM|nr:6737_t:CDS:2 [Dentiscutata erythropus]